MKIDFEFKTAFDPFYDETVKITAQRIGKTIRTSCRASVMQIQNDDPFEGSASADSDRVRFALSIPLSGEGGWNQRTPIQIGDKIVTEKGLNLAVDKVTIGVGGDTFEVEARKTK